MQLTIYLNAQLTHSLFCCLLMLNGLGSIAQPDFYVANRDGNNILRYDMDGNFKGEFVKTGLGGLSRPQEVLFHPHDGSLLVTGFQNAQIKQYDGTTGAFLGDFSSGFALTNPTKMIIGPDSMLYVSQWGGQTKIIRFDLQGNFIDEFSDISVPEGCGMAWDKESNLYVTTWSNGGNNGTAGFVRKFNAQGEDLGIALSTVNLQGPVGIWIGEDDDLFVVDWTLGQVRRFDEVTGDMKGVFISGMTRTEGNVQGPDGKYYLCDWQDNKVNRYNADGSFDSTLASGGALSVPNSITFGPDVSTSTKTPSQDLELLVFPNPSANSVQFRLPHLGATSAHLMIYESSGRLVYEKQYASISGGAQPINWISEGYAAGIYFYELKTPAASFSGELVVQPGN